MTNTKFYHDFQSVFIHEDSLLDNYEKKKTNHSLYTLVNKIHYRLSMPK